MTNNPGGADSILWVDLKAGHTIDHGERKLFHEDEGYRPELYEDIPP